MSHIIKTVFKSKLISQFLRYAIVGLIGTVVHTGILITFVEVFLYRPIIATVIGFVASLIISFILNVKWTFDVSNNYKFFLKYIIVSLLGLLLNVMIMYVFVEILDIWYGWAQIVIIVIVPIFNFSLNKYWAFSTKK